MNVQVSAQPLTVNSALKIHQQGPEIGIGILGCGVVGSALVRSLTAGCDRLTGVLAAKPVIRAIAVRDLAKPRDVPVERSLFTNDPFAVVGRADVDVIFEVIGGAEPAGSLIEFALAGRKHVITANKSLVARRGSCLKEMADSENIGLLFEAAVMAGVPVLRPLAELAGGDRVQRIEGIFNGTSNFCLHRMERDGVDLETALAEARLLGYAEPDSSDDVTGRDSASKLAIIINLVSDINVSPAGIATEGITGISPKDLKKARSRGEVLRLIARAELGEGHAEASVAPVSIPDSHLLANVKDQGNGVLVTTTLLGEIFIQGPGAGGETTAGALIRDLIEVRKRHGFTPRSFRD